MTDIEHRTIRRFLDAPKGSFEEIEALDSVIRMVDIRERMHVPAGLQPHLTPAESTWKPEIREEECVEREG